MKKIILFIALIPCVIFSQEITTEEYKLKNGEIQLPGTLTYPESNEKVPLIIFIHGSGNVDRNGNQAGANIKAGYIKMLSEKLNAKGVGFYRYDKRTATVANLQLSTNILLSDFVSDAQVAINTFKNDERFSKLILIGHSQGSLVAMLSITADIDGYVSLAGPAESIDKTIVKQLSAQSAEMGKVGAEHFKELIQTDTILQVNPLLISVFHPRNQKFFKSWAMIAPTNEIKKVKIPTLILNGDADLQVNVEDANKLKVANTNAELHIIPKMNHLLKVVNSPTENQQSYFDVSFPLSEQLVKLIVDFVNK